MKQFILNSDPDKDWIVRLEGKEHRYLVRVRRMAAGEFFPALLPNGEETIVKIISIDANVLVGKCTNSPVSSSNHDSSLPPIILLQALPKSDKMDLIVRQAAEGGITEIIPFVSEFSLGKANASGQKFSRWERIIKEARQQSGSKIATTIRLPLTIDELIFYWNELKSKNVIGLFFHHRVLEQKSIHEYLEVSPQKIIMAIGPEGGFSEKEVSLFFESGFKPLTIGDTILRTETAALYFAAAIRVILLERDAWEMKQHLNKTN